MMMMMMMMMVMLLFLRLAETSSTGHVDGDGDDSVFLSAGEGRFPKPRTREIAKRETATGSDVTGAGPPSHSH